MRGMRQILPIAVPEEPPFHFDFASHPFPTIIQLLTTDKTQWFWEGVMVSNEDDEVINRIIEILAVDLHHGAIESRNNILEMLEHLKITLRSHFSLMRSMNGMEY
eukprot:6084681-Pleurochrysis_carterae.AAC.1